jgi:hypothetical protein
MSIKIFTRTRHFKSKQHTYIPRMYGVIEGPIKICFNTSLKNSPFLRHESKRSLRPSAKDKK